MPVVAAVGLLLPVASARAQYAPLVAETWADVWEGNGAEDHSYIKDEQWVRAEARSYATDGEYGGSEGRAHAVCALTATGLVQYEYASFYAEDAEGDDAYARAEAYVRYNMLVHGQGGPRSDVDVAVKMRDVELCARAMINENVTVTFLLTVDGTPVPGTASSQASLVVVDGGGGTPVVDFNASGVYGDGSTDWFVSLEADMHFHARYVGPRTITLPTAFPLEVGFDVDYTTTLDVNGGLELAPGDYIPKSGQDIALELPFGYTIEEPQAPDCVDADTNGDGEVNVTDLLDVLAWWGSCP
ncbi:MAG: hypothetical protein ACYTG1_13635 [Planctomycetota bacterium]